MSALNGSAIDDPPLPSYEAVVHQSQAATPSARVDDNTDLVKYLTSDVSKGLFTRGYTTAHINTALKGMSENEIVSLDIDICTAMIESVLGNSPSRILSINGLSAEQSEILQNMKQQPVMTTIDQEITLRLIYRFVDVIIPPNSTYQKLVSIIQQTLNVNIPDISMKYLDDDDWLIDVISENVTNNSMNASNNNSINPSIHGTLTKNNNDNSEIYEWIKLNQLKSGDYIAVG